ncbi:MAG: hypothetical protein JWM12_220, partial [Ilumatobacteraceae bacterium]|nr:hypothetical protein [Ilumatobacteraceae bacterium]
MSTARSSSATAPSGAADRRGRRLARRNRFAGAGLLAILIVVTTFAMWSFRAINSAVTDAAAASALSDTYGHAATAVSAEESLERKYQVESNLGVRSSFDTAAVDLAAALADIQEVGNDQDRALVATVTIAHARYLDAVDRLFAAVDAGDTELSRQIDRQQSDPTFDVMEAIVLAAAGDHHEQSLRALAHLRDLEAASQRLTPIVLLTGVILAAVLAAITRGHRRTLDVIRTTAIHDSLHDALTGLPNRTLLAERCTHALATDAIAGTSTGLLLIDLDRFKEINDTFGHHYGDELLTQVGPRLAGAVRNGDTVARLGGDEFAVLLTDVRSEARAREVAGEMRAALDSPFHVEGVDLDVDASIGVAVSGVHGDDASTLLQHADIAMYIAKARNCGVFSYDPSVDGHTPAKLSLLGDLRRALERHELILHYQPKISLSTGDVVGVEALVRWQHPEHGLIMPDDFIPLAEHTGLIGPLTRDILVAALTQARAWFDSGRPVPVAVNLSARNLVDEHLPDEISKLLTARGVAADLLELEVTESALMTEPL